MPNWCTNKLTVSGPPEDIDRWIERATDGEMPLSLNRLYPQPQEIIDSAENDGDYPDEEPAWRHWRNKHWGTRWELDEHTYIETESIENGVCVIYVFETAWAPPVAAIDHVAKDFPTLTFKLLYEEVGMMFVGRYITKHGKAEHKCTRIIERKCPECENGFYPVVFSASSFCNDCWADHDTEATEKEYFGDDIK